MSENGGAVGDFRRKNRLVRTRVARSIPIPHNCDFLRCALADSAAVFRIVLRGAAPQKQAGATCRLRRTRTQAFRALTRHRRFRTRRAFFQARLPRTPKRAFRQAFPRRTLFHKPRPCRRLPFFHSNLQGVLMPSCTPLGVPPVFVKIPQVYTTAAHKKRTHFFVTTPRLLIFSRGSARMCV